MHVLQAVLYGLAMETQTVQVIYVAADDYRTLAFTVNVAEVRPQVDAIIDAFAAWQAAPDAVPVFECQERWLQNKRPKTGGELEVSPYSSYPEWALLSAEECAIKLAIERPDWGTT